MPLLEASVCFAHAASVPGNIRADKKLFCPAACQDPAPSQHPGLPNMKFVLLRLLGLPISQEWQGRVNKSRPAPKVQHGCAARNSKHVGRWRFAPACCAAQSVNQAARRSAPQSVPGHLRHAVQRHTVGLHRSPALPAPGIRCAMPPPRHFACTSMLANPSLNRTHHGLRQLAGVRRLRHLRTPANCRKPWRSG